MINVLIRSLTRKRWLRFGLRDRLARWWHDPDAAAPEGFETEFFGYRYRGNFGTFIDWSVYYFGSYAEGELLLMKDLLKAVENPVVFDIGANVGHHSLFVASIAASVYSFEPLHVVAEQLDDKIIDNRLTHVFLHRFGLGSSDQMLSFETPEDCNTGTGKFVLGSDNERAKDKMLVLQVRNGDDVVSELALSKLDFIKIDVEGFEVEVLKGLRETLTRFRPVVFFEWNQSETSLPAFQIHFPENYQFFIFEPTPPFCGVFCREPYRLRKIEMGNQTGLNSGSNFLARPIEKQ